MRSLAISGVALAALMASQPALAEIDSGVGAPPVGAMPAPPMAQMPRDMPPPPLATGPNRRLDYQRPAYGFQLPRQWMSSEYIVDYRDFGLDRPARGFGWSRYYNDMVLTDQWGRVYDVADGYNRDGGRHGGGYGRRFGSRDTDGIIGGVGGAAVGAVAGNLIAGAGSRLAGSLIGGGVGALAGLALEAALSKHHKHERPHDDRWGSDEDHYYHRGGAHWGGYPAQAWSWGGGCNCGGGGEVTTTTVVTHNGGGGYVVPRQIVTYENVYAPVRSKYVVRQAAPTKYHVREAAPVAEGKTRVRLHTKTY